MKSIFFIAFACSIVLLSSCGSDNKESDLDDASQVLIDRKLSEEYKKSIDPIIRKYFLVKEALILGDSLTAKDEAGSLVTVMYGIPYSVVPVEDKFRFLKMQEDIIAHGKDIVESPTIEGQRVGFDSLSHDLYRLLVDIGADSMVVYKQYCPMAFNNTGAFWLSNDPEVLNPYFGDAMLRCGYNEEVITIKSVSNE